MLKQGSSWHDITDYYRARKRAIKLKAETGDKVVTQSPKREKSQKKKKVQGEPVDSGSASNNRGISRSPSTPGRQYPDPIWKRQMRTMPVEHSKFIWDVVSYISNLQAFFSFAIGCDIPSHIVRRAIEDNDPSDDDISLEDCVV